MDILVNGELFTSKTALKAAIVAILGRYEVGQLLDQDDTDFMYDVIHMHPNADEKIGCGIKAFGIQRNASYKNKEFMLIRKDGTQTDFSFNKCLRSPTPLARFLQACRQSIADGIIAFRYAYFQSTPNPVCELSGVPLTMDNSHVDHAPPHTFRWIAEMFIQKYRVDVERVTLTSGGDNSCRVLMPSDLEALWTDYHWQYAKLRVISAAENMKRGTHGVELPTPKEVSQHIKDYIRAEMESDGWTLREK